MFNTPLVHLRHLAEEIGPRASGTPGNLAASGYIQDVFTACGLAVEAQSFNVPAWSASLTHLTVAEDALDAKANAFSPACDVSAPLLPLGTLEELEQADLGGRLAVLYGDLTKTPLSAKAWMFKSESDARVVELLDGPSRPRPTALLTVQNRPGQLELLVEDWEFTVPSATVSAKAGLRLVQSGGAMARLRIEAEQQPGQTANIVGRTVGTGAERIVLCAHFDTKFDTPGASDNGGGVAVLLALAQRLSHAGLGCGLEFVAFANEEYLPLGDDAYVRRGESYFGAILAALNFDGVGPALGSNTITAMACSPELEARIRKIHGDWPGVAWVAPWPESNHSTFAFRGVPSLAFSNTAVMRHAHLRSDTIAWMSAAKLEETVGLAADIIDSLHSQTPAWGREPRQHEGA